MPQCHCDKGHHRLNLQKSKNPEILYGRQLLQLPLASSVDDQCLSEACRVSFIFPHHVLRWDNHRAELADFYAQYEFGQQTYLGAEVEEVELVREASVAEYLVSDSFRRVNRVLRHERPGRSWITGHRLATREGYLNSRQSDGA